MKTKLIIISLLCCLTLSARQPYSFQYNFETQDGTGWSLNSPEGWVRREIDDAQRLIFFLSEEPEDQNHYAYTTLSSLPAGRYSISCTYCVFQPSYSGTNDPDFVRIVLIPNNETPLPQNSFTNTTLPSSWISLDNNAALIMYDTETTLNATFDVNTQGDYKLAFAFQYNDANEIDTEEGTLFAQIKDINITATEECHEYSENGNIYRLCHNYTTSANTATLVQATADSTELREVTIVDDLMASPIDLTHFAPYNARITLPSNITYDTENYTLYHLADTAFAKSGKHPLRIDIPSTMTSLPAKAFGNRNFLIVHNQMAPPSFAPDATPQTVVLERENHISHPYHVKGNDITLEQRPFADNTMKVKAIPHTDKKSTTEGTCHHYIIEWDTTSGFSNTAMTDSTFEAKLTAEAVVEGKLGYDAIVSAGETSSTSASTHFSDSLRYLIFATEVYSLPSYMISGPRELALPSRSKARLDLKIDNTRYFHFSLPFNSELSDLTIKAYNANGSLTDITYSAQRPEDIEDENNNFYSIFSFNEQVRAQSTTVENSYIPLAENTTLEAGKGYLVAIYEGATNPATSATLSFPSGTGITLHSTSSSVTIPTSHTSGQPDYRSGWNLIGNPFTYKIPGQNLPKVFAKVTYDDGETNTIDHYDIEAYPNDFTFDPFTTIFVQSDGTNPLVVNGSVAQPISAACMRNDIPDHMEITITDENGNSDHTNIVHKTNASAHYIIGEDLARLGSGSQTTICTLSDSVRCAFNEQEIDSTGKAISLHLVTSHEGDYTFTVNNDRTQWNGKILLSDNEANTLTDIKTDPYTVHLADSTYSTRFSILLTHNETIVGEETITDNNIVIFTTGNGNIVLTNLPANPLNIQLSAITGQTICTMTADNVSELTIPHHLLPQNGLLVLTLRTSTSITSYKVMTHRR